MFPPPNEPEVRAFLRLLFGSLIDETGGFARGRMPVWNGATKRTTWCRTIDEAVAAFQSASLEGEDAYVPVALHDPAVAIAVAQKKEDGKAQQEGRPPRQLEPQYVRGCYESATAIVALWLDEDHAGGQHKRPKLPPDLATILGYLAEIPHPLSMSLIIDTGGGVHGWSMLREPFLIENDEDRARAASLARRYQAVVADVVAPQYAHDSTADLARLLRVPGTLNSKYGTLARVIEPVTGDPITIPEDVYRVNLSEIEEELDLLAIQDDGAPSGQSAGTGTALTIGAKLPPSVQRVLDSTPKVRGYFEGRGKPELGSDGRTPDMSSSGYDFSLAMALARKGVTDPLDIATALWWRPDGAAKAKGRKYIERTVDRALGRVAALDERDTEELLAALDFRVEGVRIFDSDPAVYELTIEGTALRLTSGQLMSPKKFAVRFTDAFKRIPALPKDGHDWVEIANHWLAQGVRVEMPPDASDEPALREAVQRAVEDLPVGDAAEDLDHGKAVGLDDHRHVFKTATVFKVVFDDHPNLTRAGLSRVLRDLGYANGTHRIGDKSVRCWSWAPTAPVTRAGET